MEYFFTTTIFYFSFLLIGVGPVIKMKKFLGVNNLYTLTIYSISLGILFSSFIFLVIGSFRLRFLGDTYPFILLSLIFCSLLLFIQDQRRNIKNFLDIFWGNSKEYFKDRSNFFMVAMIIFLLIFTLLMNSKVYVHRIDEFRYWLADARYIYTTGGLRFDQNIVPTANYSSFFTLQLAQVHRFFGKLIEQYTSIVPIMYLYLGLALIQINLKIKDKGGYILSILAILLIYLILYSESFLAYADISLAFYILLATILITRRVDINTYYLKVGVLSVVILATAFVKLPLLQYSPYAILLTVSWLIHDRKFITKLISSKSAFLKSIFTLIFPLIIIFSNYIYRKSVYINDPSEISEGPSNHIYSSIKYLIELSSLEHLLEYPIFVGEYFAQHFLGLMLFLIFLCLLTLTYYFASIRNGGGIRKSLSDKKVNLFSVIIFTFPLLNLGYYAIYNRRSQLDRYLTTTIFLTGMLLLLLYYKDIFSKYKNFLILFMSFLVIITFHDFFTPGFKQLISPSHTGSYSDSAQFTETTAIVDDVKQIINEEKIIISKIDITCGIKEDKCITNNSNDLKKYEYFLQESLVYGLYDIKVEDFTKMLDAKRINYILTTIGFQFVEVYQTEGDKNKFIHLYRYDSQTKKFEYIKGYQDFDYY